jgi:hypothetical protein
MANHDGKSLIQLTQHVFFWLAFDDPSMAIGFPAL